jgi:glycosyltransferase involved in cell wall biosynthesis
VLSSGSRSISVFFPAFNDAPALPALIEKAFSVLQENAEVFEVIVVNDGSIDDTKAVLQKLQSRFGPRLRVIEHDSNLGYGAALRTGLAAARYELVFYTDGDGQYDVGELPLLLSQMREGVGLVNGFKLKRHDPWHRIMIGAIYNRFVRALFGIRLRDIDCDFRLMRRDTIESLHLESNTGTICLELVRGFEMSGCGVMEVGVHHYPRLYGRSQFFRIRALLTTLHQLIHLYWKLVLMPAISRTAAFMGGSSWGWAAWGTLTLAALVISRSVIFPKYLVTFDQINFAFAIEHFNPALQQPQPPGYPVFVGLLKLLSPVLPEIELVFLAAGLLMSAVALAVVWSLGERMVGQGQGKIAMWLLLFNPAFWLSALTSPVRICFAAGATAVALCAWLACERKSAYWFIAAAAVLGLSAGARPALALLMAPLLAFAALHMRLRWRFAFLAVLACCAVVAMWLPATVMAVGGVREFYSLLRRYTHAQMGSTSILFGARPAANLRMAGQAVAWSCLGALSWMWALPLGLRTAFRRLNAFAQRFLVLWFVPGLLFYAVFHVGDPDHTLSIIPVTCIAGAAVLASITKGRPAETRGAVIAFSVLLNIFLFFKPISTTTMASTYTAVRQMDDYMADVIEGVRAFKRSPPVTVVLLADTPGWRNLSYYDPDAHIVVVPMYPAPHGQLTTAYIHERRSIQQKSPKGVVRLPACGTLAWIDRKAGPVASDGSPVPSTRPRVFAVPAVAGKSYEYHGIRYVVNGGTCVAATAY